jgi:serine protease Do
VLISSDGYILTNNHVVEGAKEVQVTLNDKAEYQAKVIGRDALTDLAILKIKAGDNLPYATIGDSGQANVGDWVLAIGNPFGLGTTVTSGIVSAKGRVIGAGPYDDFIQTDAAINPGNSGGPLFNMKGEVIGINTAIMESGHGLGFAIPINTAKPLIPQLESKGEVTRGYLGASIQTITPELSKALGLKGTEGALVAGVVPGGAAEKAGIKAGDVIVAFDGKKVQSGQALPAMVAATPVGRDVSVTIIRDGREKSVSAVIAKLDARENSREETAEPAQGKLGLAIRDLDPQTARKLGLKDDHGVLVVGVQPGSPAQLAAIQDHDVILEVNRQSVESAKDFKDKVAQAGDSLLLLVKNDQGQRYTIVSR